MAEATRVTCPVCGCDLQQAGDDKRCPQCKLTVIAEVEVRVEPLKDKGLLVKLYGDQTRRLGQWRPLEKQKQLYGYSEGKWFITTSWPSPEEKTRFRKEPVPWNTEFSGLADEQNLGPRVVWGPGFTFSPIPHEGIRARIPKICRIPPGEHPATVVRQDGYVYLVFPVEQAQSAQKT